MMIMMVLIIDDGDDNDGNWYDDGKFYNVFYASCIIYNPMSECIDKRCFQWWLWCNDDDNA